MYFKVVYEPVVPVKPEVEFVIITLSKEEAVFLQAILGNTSGYDGVGGMREFTSNLWNELYAVSKEMYPMEHKLSGLIHIK